MDAQDARLVRRPCADDGQRGVDYFAVSQFTTVTR